MKKIFYISTILFLLSFYSCRKAQKNADDYYPEVTTVSAKVAIDGSVEVTANVTLKSGTIDYIGFCMDTLPIPNMMSNQKVITELNGSEFKAVYAMNFNPAKTYYFRSWAASSSGYSYGNVIALSSIKATPVVAPCSLNVNSCNVGLFGSSGSGPTGSVYQVSAVNNFSSTWDISMIGYDASAGRLNLQFGSALNTKVYTTTSGSPFGDQVYISVTSNFTSGVVEAGSKVYVNQLSSGVYEITICDAPWKISGFSSSTVRLNARFKSPL